MTKNIFVPIANTFLHCFFMNMVNEIPCEFYFPVVKREISMNLMHDARMILGKWQMPLGQYH